MTINRDFLVLHHIVILSEAALYLLEELLERVCYLPAHVFFAAISVEVHFFYSSLDTTVVSTCYQLIGLHGAIVLVQQLARVV